MNTLRKTKLKLAVAAVAWLALLGSPYLRAQAVSGWQQMQGAVADASAAQTPEGRVETAAYKVQQAQAALDSGQEPLPGERTGLANGHSRLNSAYFDRINRLELQLKKAQAQLHWANSQRDAPPPQQAY